MTETPKLLLEKDGPIGWIVFNQPEKRNAVSQEMWELMPDYVKDLAADDTIRVVVLRGAGEQAFVAGADISQFKERRRNMADEAEYSRISARGQEALASLEKPLLAMIHGFCVGGGVSIAITCDIRLAADDARFGIPAARLGLGYHYRGMEKLMALVGPAYTREIFFTARTDFSAADALRMGLVNQVVPKAELEAFTRQYASTIARNAPLTIRSAKQTVEQLLRPAAERDTARLDRLIAECFNSQDYQEGVRAFSEKRRPQFQGR
jgi:enoyl-CoA hydratase/carnithine racemase